MKLKKIMAISLAILGVLGCSWGQISESMLAAEPTTPDIVVVLDPGHDAKHSGATYYNYYEHELVFEIASYCKEELEKYNGVEVYLTRTSNKCAFGTKGSTECLKCSKGYGANEERTGCSICKPGYYSPEDSFCMMPKKFTIWLHKVAKCEAGAEVILPGTPPRPSLISCFEDHPAQ